MKWLLAFLSVVPVVVVVGCSSDPDPTPARGDDDPSSDENRADAAGKTDQTGGRDTTGASCFAACQNNSMICSTTGEKATTDVFLELDGSRGCKGNYGKQTLTIDCLPAEGAPKVCVDSTCVDGTYSALTYAYGKTLCTKNNN